MKHTVAITLVAVFTVQIIQSNGASPFKGAGGGKATRGDVINYFKSISGKYTVAGQHNREPNSDPSKWTRVVRDITGVLPGLWGGDFLFLPDDVKNRQTMINEAIKQWNNGVLVALTWHVCPPTVGDTCNWDSNGILSSLNNDQWNELVSNGAGLNNAWKARLDSIVPFLKQLQAAGVVALWRPIHEMNEGWSWWGGRPGSNGSRRLYQITRDYLTGVHGLDNLVWTWCVKDTDMGNVGEYWPGPNYVDVAALDVWVNKYPTNADYQRMLSLAGGIPIALGEVGALPTPDILQSQNQWVYFMVWAEYLKNPSFNTDASIKACYYNSRVLHQGDLGTGGSSPPAGNTNLALNRPVWASSVETAALGAEKAVDGNLSTRWASVSGGEAWFILDLGSPTTIRRVNIYWENAYATGYQLQSSNDNSKWTTVYENYGGTGGLSQITLSSSVNTRYLKVYAFKRATQYGYSFYEIQIYSS